MIASDPISDRLAVWIDPARQPELFAEACLAVAAFLALEGVDPGTITIGVSYGTMRVRWPGCGESYGSMTLPSPSACPA